MQTTELLKLQLNHLITQSRQNIYTLSTQNDSSTNQLLLQQLWDNISAIHFIGELLVNQALSNEQLALVQQQMTTQQRPVNQTTIPAITPSPTPPPSIPNQQTFTIEELATYDGKNGRPAFVAVNGTVYDVTNNRAWAAATHFGLIAGKDYTEEFGTCHTGQESILATLPAVGRIG